MELITSEVSWRSDTIKMFGKEFEQKRKVAWVGDNFVKYTYSKIQMIATGWTNELKKIRERIDEDFHHNFNSCLVNLYRDGEDHMSYHADNEKELRINPVIFSLSLGESRDFYFKHNESKEVVKLQLNNGDLLIMQGQTQDCWKHSIPKRSRIKNPRLNLTFRKIY